MSISNDGCIARHVGTEDKYGATHSQSTARGNYGWDNGVHSWTLQFELQNKCDWGVVVCCLFYKMFMNFFFFLGCLHRQAQSFIFKRSLKTSSDIWS